MSMMIKEFIRHIRKLPSDPVIDNPRVWYRTQKEHWLVWLSQYGGPGAYGRKTGIVRDAKFAYNHIVCPEMLLYMIRAVEMPADIISAAEGAYQDGATQMEKSGKIRKVVPWNVIESALLEWDKRNPPASRLTRFFNRRR